MFTPVQLPSEKEDIMLARLNQIGQENSLVKILSETDLTEKWTEPNKSEVNDNLAKQVCVTLRLKLETLSTQGFITTLTDALFFYIINGCDCKTEQLFNRVFQHYECHFTLTWFHSCGPPRWNFRHQKFVPCFKKLSDDAKGLELLFYIYPQLLLNLTSVSLLDQVVDVIGYKIIHHMIYTARDKLNRTGLFYMAMYDPGIFDVFEKLYGNNVSDLYDLLTVQDSNKQTVLHVNKSFAGWFIEIVITNYSEKYKDQLKKLLTTTIDSAREIDGWIYGPRHYYTWLLEQINNDCYFLDFEPRVVIVYYTQDRIGAHKESQSLYKAFHSVGFPEKHIHVQQDLKKAELIRTLEDFSNKKCTAKWSNITEPTIIVVIMAHGGKGFILDSAMKPVMLTSIEKAMCSNKNMTNRPKMLIVQSCRKVSDYVQCGEKRRRSDPVPSEMNMPMEYHIAHEHFCLIQSCLVDQYSERNTMIPILADKIRNVKPNMDICEIFRQVKREVERTTDHQTPILLSTLGYKFCLGNVMTRALMQSYFRVRIR